MPKGNFPEGKPLENPCRTPKWRPLKMAAIWPHEMFCISATNGPILIFVFFFESSCEEESFLSVCICRPPRAIHELIKISYTASGATNSLQAVVIEERIDQTSIHSPAIMVHPHPSGPCCCPSLSMHNHKLGLPHMLNEDLMPFLLVAEFVDCEFLK